MDRFRGRVAVVTGASAGIGEAIARQLCVDHGMKVVGVARRVGRLLKMEKEFNITQNAARYMVKYLHFLEELANIG